MLKSKHNWLLACLIACVFAGCGDPNRTKIIGTWGIDSADTLMSRIKQSDVKRDEDSDSPKMIMHFRSNGEFDTKTQMGAVDRKKEGQWKLVAFDPATGSMVISCEIQTETTEHEINFVDEDTIEMVPPNMAGTKMKLRFRRQ